jgi:hypothetical protein
MHLMTELRLNMRMHRPLISILEDLPVCAETVGRIYPLKLSLTSPSILIHHLIEEGLESTVRDSLNRLLQVLMCLLAVPVPLLLKHFF